MNLWDPRPRQPLIFLALWAVAGIFAADRWNLAPAWPIAAFAAAVVFAFVRPSTTGCWLTCALGFFTLHTFLFHGSEGQSLALQLAAGPRVIHATGIVRTEPEKPTVWSRNITARFRLQVDSMQMAGESRAADLWMNVAWAGTNMPEYGDRVSIVGSARLIESPRNPGQFDYASYVRRQGVFCEIRASYPTDCRIESHGHGNPVQAFAFRSRRWIQNRLALDLDDDPAIADVIQSIVLGLKKDTPEDLKALFQRTGTVHLVAVSGLNVVMLATIVEFLLRRLRTGRFLSACLIILVLWVYAIITGLGAACLRATVMYSLVLLAGVFDRRSLSFNSLGAAALLILAWDTNELFSTGFQFSFGVVAIIIACSSRIQRFAEPFGMPDAFLPRQLWNWRQKTRAVIWQKCAAMLGLTVSAWAGSLFFTAGYFHLISPSALAANVFAVFIAFGILILGVGSLLMAPICKTGAVLCNNANWFCAKTLVAALRMFTAMPGGYMYVEIPRLSRSTQAEFAILDLGDGGAMHLRSGGRDWLIDCGNGSAYERIVLPYLRLRGVNRLDGLLLAHGSARRLGSAITALDDFRPGAIATSVLRDRSSARNRFHAELARRNLGKGLYERGDHVRITDGVAFRVLYPPAGLKRSAADDKALVLQCDCGGTRVLLMSDSGFSTEQWLMENEADLRSDLLIKGQHSRDFSGTLDFLARVQPQVIICGAAPFGRPPDALDAWEQDVIQRGITVFRQDHTGEVRLEVIGEGRFEVRAFLGGQTFLSRAR